MFVGWMVAMASMVRITISVESAALLLAICLVPPALLMMLWPGVQARTAGEILRGDLNA